MGLHLDTCLNERKLQFSIIFAFLLYLAFLLYIIVLNVMHVIMKRLRRNVVTNEPSNNYLLWMANIFLLTSLQYIAIPNIETSVYFEIPATFILLADPVINIFILYYYNRDFNTFFKHIFSLRCFSYQTDELEESPVTFSNNDSVSVNNENKL